MKVGNGFIRSVKAPPYVIQGGNGFIRSVKAEGINAFPTSFDKEGMRAANCRPYRSLWVKRALRQSIWSNKRLAKRGEMCYSEHEKI